MEEIHSVIKALLAELPDGNIVEQFKSRNIVGVRLIKSPPLINGGIWLDLSKLHDKPEEMIYIIELSETDPIDQWLITVGHEFCHTFDATLIFASECLTDYLAKLFCKHYGGPIDGWTEWLRIADEIFCEMFARRWLNEKNNYKEAVQLLDVLKERKRLFF